MSDATPQSARPIRAKLPAAVILLGFTSFFTDASSEMIFPLLPLFLTATLGATPTFLGLVEGAADAVSAFLKLWSGNLADRVQRRKPIVVVGYSIATFVRPLVALAGAPWHVFAVRVVDRVGKGIRSSPRDALIADAAPPGAAGRAFGFHRSMDHAGAVVGPLLAAGLLALDVELRWVFAAAIVPGILALICVCLVKEAPRPPAVPSSSSSSSSSSPPAAGARLPRSLRGYFAILALFTLGNASDAFLLLRAMELGVQNAVIPLLWTAFHVVKVGANLVFGGLSDRVDRVTLIVIGWGVYGVAYIGFGLATTQWQIWALFAVYGVYYGLCEPAEKALVKDLAPPELRGRAYGGYNFTVGIMAIPAGLLMGLLWTHASPLVALSTGAGLALAAAGALLVWRRATSG